MKRALVFPGQGAQILGMGRTVADAYPEARQVFEEVNDALSSKLTDIIWGENQEELNLTINAQPALMATSIAVLKALEAEGLDRHKVCYLAGHSLGEYTALCAARSLPLDVTSRLLRVRGEAMQAAVPVGEGGMAALLGLDISLAEAVAQEAAEKGVCEVANDNDPKQVVISGHISPLENAIKIAAEKGARRAVRLKTSAPFHCRLMQPAADRMKAELAETTIFSPQIPVIANITARQAIDIATIKRQLVEQVTGRVRWRETVIYMQEQNIESIVEVGAGNALSGMIRRTAPSVSTTACAAPEDIHSLVAQWKESSDV